MAEIKERLRRKEEALKLTLYTGLPVAVLLATHARTLENASMPKPPVPEEVSVLHPTSHLFSSSQSSTNKRLRNTAVLR